MPCGGTRTAVIRRVSKVAMANPRRRAVSILWPSYAANTGRSATLLHAPKVGLFIQKEHNVPKEELLEFEGLVTEILPDARYRVQLDNGHQLVVYTAGRMKKIGSKPWPGIA
jgi:hypothetical protein